MRIALESVDLTNLPELNGADYILVSDASVHHRESRNGWVSVVLNEEGNGEVLYGVQNGILDVQVVEFAPIITAIQILAATLAVKSHTIFRPRVCIITDSLALVHQSKGGQRTVTAGMWKQIESYIDVFDIRFVHAPRRSSPLLVFVDVAAKAVNKKNIAIESTVNSLVGKHRRVLRNNRATNLKT